MNLFFKNFINLTAEEADLVLNMRNSLSVRSKMYNQDIISLEEHKKWLTTLQINKSCLYFLVYADNVPIGVVDFTHITDTSCEWGYYLDEKYLGSGYGILLEYYLISYAFDKLNIKKLYCAVLEENKNVYNTHIQFFSFSPDQKYSSYKNVNGRGLQFDGLSITVKTWQQWNNPMVLRSLKFFKVGSVVWDTE